MGVLKVRLVSYQTSSYLYFCLGTFFGSLASYSSSFFLFFFFADIFWEVYFLNILPFLPFKWEVLQSGTTGNNKVRDTPFSIVKKKCAWPWRYRCEVYVRSAGRTCGRCGEVESLLCPEQPMMSFVHPKTPSSDSVKTYPCHFAQLQPPSDKSSLVVTLDSPKAGTCGSTTNYWNTKAMECNCVMQATDSEMTAHNALPSKQCTQSQGHCLRRGTEREGLFYLPASFSRRKMVADVR